MFFIYFFTFVSAVRLIPLTKTIWNKRYNTAFAWIPDLSWDYIWAKADLRPSLVAVFVGLLSVPHFNVGHRNRCTIKLKFAKFWHHSISSNSSGVWQFTKFTWSLDYTVHRMQLMKIPDIDWYTMHIRVNIGTVLWTVWMCYCSPTQYAIQIFDFWSTWFSSFLYYTSNDRPRAAWNW